MKFFVKSRKDKSFTSVVFFVIALSMVFSGFNIPYGPVLTANAAISEKTSVPVQLSLPTINIGSVEAHTEINVDLDTNWKTRLTLATVTNAQGPWHIVGLDVRSRPDYFGFVGDTKNASEFEKWAESQTRDLAVRFGYFDPLNYGEIRISSPNNVAIFIGKDENDNFVCKEYAKNSNGEFPNQDSPTRTIKAASSYEDAQFLAHEDASGNFVASASYEYLYVPPAAQGEV